jgi:hypothetical protein
MGIGKAKEALKKAQNDSPNDKRLISKRKDAVRKKRAASMSDFEPSCPGQQFPGQHRGY